MACGAFTSPLAKPGERRAPSFARQLPLTGSAMNQSDFRDYHEREAMRLRSLIANATTRP